MVKPNGKDSSSSSLYRGVRKRKWGKWVSEVRLPNSRERIWLGSYDTPEKAARAFDAALYCLRGKTANFNFPENPPEILNGRSMTPSEIQVAAARFANSEERAGPKEGGEAEFPVGLRESPDRSSSSWDTFRAESPSVSTSNRTTSEMTLDNGFVDMYSSNDMSNFGIFPGFDDLSGEFFVPPPSSSEENYLDYNDGFQSQGSSFLWNF
ncbi:unnamed protein product [Withania somnifera]